MFDEEEVLTSGSISSSRVPRVIMRLAERLAARHGTVTISDEASGIHIHLADPEELIASGPKELQSRHLAINAEKYFGIGRYDVDEFPTIENKEMYAKYHAQDKEVPCAVSMKTGKTYRVEDLLHMPTLQARSSMFKNVSAGKVVVGANKRLLVRDEFGNLVPEWVEEAVPLTSLPDNHPAITYLTQRGFDPAKLEKQFEACYCTKEKPESRGEGRYYSRLPGGMKNTPQGRIIFSVRMNGVRWGYQSRYIDTWAGDNHLFWSHNQQWELIERRLPDGTLYEKYPADTRFPKGFAPHKYMNATGCERNKLLMGFDAAVASQKDKPFNMRYCVLVEGPLDAGKIGPPGIALLGKSMSDFQAEAIRKNFSKVFTMMDNDAAGKQCFAKIQSKLPNIDIVDIKVPDHVKDVGDLSYEEVENLLKPYTQNLK